jgi:hypothetical protein
MPWCGSCLGDIGPNRLHVLHDGVPNRSLTFAPAVSFTFDSVTINMAGNTSAGEVNTASTQSPIAIDKAVIMLSVTDTTSIVGDSVELESFFPYASNVFETFPAVPVPGSVFAGSGARDFTITGDTVTIVNTTSGWSAASFNGFEILDVTRLGEGPPNSGVPDTASTRLPVGAGLAALAAFRRSPAFAQK